MLTMCSTMLRRGPLQFSQFRSAGNLCLEGVSLSDPKSFKIFHDQVSKVFASEEGYVSFANEVYSAEGRERFMQGVNKGELLLKMTVCSTTTWLIKQIALKTLFKNPDCSLDVLKSIDSFQDVASEMITNDLALYEFCLSKGVYNHVFTVIKFPTTAHDPVFALYQSHIQAYTLKTFMASRQFKIYFHHEIAGMLKPFIDISDDETEWHDDHYTAFRKFSQYDLWTHDRQLRYLSAASRMQWRLTHEKSAKE